MAIKKNLALFALFVFSTPAFAQGFGSPNGVGFPSTSSGSGASPLTTKGDVFTFSTVNTRLPVGTNGQLLSADNTQATGLKWITASGTGTVTSFSSNNLSPLFTTSVATGTTTPVLSFALSNAGAHTYFGNNTGSSTAPSFLTNTQLTADLNVFTSSLQGVVPASGGGTTNFLRADGSWAAPAGGGGMTNPLTTTGDTIYSSSGSTPARLGIGKYDQQYSPSLSGVPAWSDRPVAPSVTTSELRVPWFARTAQAGSNGLSITGAGGASTAGSGFTATSTDGIWVQYQSAATTNSDAGFSAGDIVRFDAKPRFWARVKIIDTTVERFWCGFQRTGIVGSSADTVIDSCGFRYNPATDVNGNIRFYTTNGSTPTVVDTGVPFTAGIYQFTVDASNPSSYVGYIYNGGTLTTTTISTNLPVSTSVCTASVLLRTLENVAKNIKIASFFGDNI